MIPNSILLGIDIKAWLGLAAFGAVISTIGALLGVLLKDYVFARALERWKQQQSLEQTYRRFRDPLALSARELARRTREILDQYPPGYLSEEVLASRPTKLTENSYEDPYFLRYKLVSTAYRLSAFLAWLELYRQETTFLHPGKNKHAKALEVAVGRIRSDLADGHLNLAKDWNEWRDGLIFREELRAIGDSLIETRGSTRTVMGYGRYCDQLESDSGNAVQRWSPLVFTFYLDLETNGRDFREVRLRLMLVHIVELMKLLDPSLLDSDLQESAEAYAKV